MKVFVALDTDIVGIGIDICPFWGIYAVLA